MVLKECFAIIPNLIFQFFPAPEGCLKNRTSFCPTTGGEGKDGGLFNSGKVWYFLIKRNGNHELFANKPGTHTIQNQRPVIAGAIRGTAFFVRPVLIGLTAWVGFLPTKPRFRFPVRQEKAGIAISGILYI
jgi:hypothetical protein